MDQLHYIYNYTEQLEWLDKKVSICIVNNTAPSTAMSRLRGLRQELKDSSARNVGAWDWRNLKPGNWGANLAKIGITALVVLIIITVRLLHYTHSERCSDSGFRPTDEHDGN